MSTPTHKRILDHIDRMDAEELDQSLLRFGLALFVLTVAYFAALSTYYTRRALSQLWEAAELIGYAIVATAMYNALAGIIQSVLIRAGSAVMEAADDSDRVSQRSAAALAVVVVAALCYGTYRVAKWAVEPYRDYFQEPDPEEHTLDEFQNGPLGGMDPENIEFPQEGDD